jgi:mono/diheme cytochrome c family protein
MKLIPHFTVGVLLLGMYSTGCSTDPASLAETAAFKPVQAVLETNCVHCHGDNRLSMMPSIHDSRALAKLIGSGQWIVPGKPEQSRFFQVVTFPDQVPGAMPPTGHAITKQEVATLRQWIASGARVPGGATILFTPRGEMPRSM